ncbi:hypothetical protein ScPMuIL_007287 [Solemya velum]
MFWERHCEDDQVNVKALVDSWQVESPEDNFFFQPSSSVDHMLLVYQSSSQRDLLRKYGEEFVLMDSTHNITRYDIPLFLVCVATNVGYYVVGSFFTERETAEQIASGLEVLKQWNKTWKPISFMCDYDVSEISAVEQTFKGCDVYVCDFHREQAWLRWLKRKEVKQDGEAVLKILREIAQSDDEDMYVANVTALKSLPIYSTNTDLKNWLDKFWLPQKKRWVYCYRKDSLKLRVNTTNGVEAQHSVLKRKFLKSCNGSISLSAVVKIIIKEFLTCDQERYIRKNVEKGADLLQSVFQKLTEIEKMILESVPKLSNLPLRRKTKRKFNKGKKSLEKSAEQRMVKQSSQSHEKEFTDENEQDDIFDKLLEEIWINQEMTQGKILGRIGPYSISDSSIRHLGGAISDEIIDAYFYLLDEKSPSICHINCIVMTAIFNGSTERLGILQRENFNAYDCIFGVVNEGGSHWTLVAISQTAT